MRTTIVLLFKFVVTFIASWISFVLIDINPINMVLFVALSGVAINYVLGDLIILPSMGNIIASVGDGILAAATAYVIDLFSYNFTASTTGLIIFAAIIGVCEYFFHIYLMRDEQVNTNDYRNEPPFE